MKEKAVEGRFPHEHLERVQKENEALKESISQIKARLSDAEASLAFYGDVRNYMTRPLCGVFTYQDVLKNDSEVASNTDNTKVAGYRARQHLRRYENVSSP